MCKNILFISQFTFIGKRVNVSDVGVLKKWLCKCRMNIYIFFIIIKNEYFIEITFRIDNMM